MKMKITSKKILRTLGLGTALLAGTLAPHRAAAYVYYTREALVAAVFPPGTELRPVEWTPDAAALARLKATLGYAPRAEGWDLVVATQGGTVTGYLVFDAERGQHDLIDIATLVGPNGAVERVEVMVYREAYGDGVRAPGFLAQFIGRTAADPMRPGREIRIVSGSTLSTRALSVAVRRACALVEAWRAAGAPGA